jgi:hypothetical protein
MGGNISGLVLVIAVSMWNQKAVTCGAAGNIAVCLSVTNVAPKTQRTNLTYLDFQQGSAGQQRWHMAHCWVLQGSCVTKLVVTYRRLNK